MKYIKAKFRMTHPSVEPFDVYGWETEWLKKTQDIGGRIVSIGEIVNFQNITCTPDGKFLFPATKKNVEKAKALLKLRQISLAPGENLEVAQEAEHKVVEDVWPDAPGASVVAEDAEFSDVVNEEVAAAPVAAKPAKKPRARQPEDLTPDTEA